VFFEECGSLTRRGAWLQDGSLACGDGACIERGLFCNGEKDCNDGSDENSCGKYATFSEIPPKQVSQGRVAVCQESCLSLRRQP